MSLGRFIALEDTAGGSWVAQTLSFNSGNDLSHDLRVVRSSFMLVSMLGMEPVWDAPPPPHSLLLSLFLLRKKKKKDTVVIGLHPG